MKDPNMNYAQRQLQLLIRLILVSGAMLFFVLSGQAQTDAILPPIGGPGGGQFVARCPRGQFLTGFELQTGDDVDAIRPLCVIAFGPEEVGTIKPYQSKLGGDDGGLRQLLCPEDAPIVTRIDIGAEGVKTLIVNNIHLFCGVAATTQTWSEFPAAVFDGPAAHGTYSFAIVSNDDVRVTSGSQRCPAGLVAVGINGRSGSWLDAVGLICGPPKLTPKPPAPIALGRVQSTAPKGPPMSLCERARDARARNSPAAPALEAQCRAAGDKPPRLVLGSVQELPQKKKQDQIIIKDRSKQGLPDFKDRIRVGDPVAADAIRITVRYPKEYGYKSDSGLFIGSGPTSCDAFSISAELDPSIRLEHLYGISRTDKMRESNGFYVCDFEIIDLPLNAQIRVGVDLGDHRSLPFEPWKGGSLTQPPPGQQRTILGAKKTVMLTGAGPGATLVFEMVYAEPPLKPLNQPVPQRRRFPAPSPGGAATPPVRRIDD